MARGVQPTRELALRRLVAAARANIPGVDLVSITVHRRDRPFRRDAEQVEQLSEALHTRTDIGIAVGIVMERYGIDRNRVVAYLVRHSSERNVKLRLLAQQVIADTFRSTAQDDSSKNGA